MQEQVTVSVVMPVHDGKEYLRPCLESVRSQTLDAFECICVNDHSTDGAREVLQEFADSDPRFRVLDSAERGAGAARNLGLSEAKGRYLLFLDADDLFEPTLLETLSARAEATEADIVFCPNRIYDTATGVVSDIKIVKFPEIDPATEYPFRAEGGPSLMAYAPCPWNKLFRADFVRRERLSFQALPSANDLFFTTTAKIVARRCASVPEALILYRVGQKANITAKVHKDPSCVVKALRAAWEFIVERGLESEMTARFVAFSCPNIWYTLNLVKDAPEAQSAFVAYLREAGLIERLGDAVRAHCPDDPAAVADFGRLQVVFDDVSRARGLLQPGS